MTDGEYSLLMLLGLVTAVAIYLFAVVRSQKKVIAALTEAGPKDAGESRAPAEVDALRERVHVLERITVDKENSLAREIDELRDR